MKKYIYKPSNFYNKYSIYYIEDNEKIPDGYYRITRKEAIQYCVEESYRRKIDYSFSGYAPETIYKYYNCDYSDDYSSHYNSCAFCPYCEVENRIGYCNKR